MKKERLCKILDMHGITYVENGRVIADDVYTKDGNTFVVKIDLTDYTRSQLYDWLGY